MSVASVYEEKIKIIYDFINKLSQDEKKILLTKLIKDDIKMYFDVIFEERKFLEKEAGVDDVIGYEDTSDKYWHDEEDAGKVDKEAENAYYLDHKKKLGNDKFDGFLGYINSSGDGGNKNDI